MEEAQPWHGHIAQQYRTADEHLLTLELEDPGHRRVSKVGHQASHEENQPRQRTRMAGILYRTELGKKT
jgi:hypothetical protein